MLELFNFAVKIQTVFPQLDQDGKILENKILENYKLLKLNSHKLIVFWFYHA